MYAFVLAIGHLALLSRSVEERRTIVVASGHQTEPRLSQRAGGPRGRAMTSGLLIREFEPGDETHFRRLNEEWIVRYFALETKDEYSFSDPQHTILDHGGRIFFAVRDDEVVGCCALLALAPGEFEVSKMAVTPSSQGSGIGRRLLESAIAGARSCGARRLYLETNHTLAPAIHLYESLGFRYVPSERVVSSPYARADVFMELYLQTGP
jgi:ribosomal protein S18 acetylase RimI-like enzyme